MRPLTNALASLAIAATALAGGWLIRRREAPARPEAAAALSAQVQEVERELRALRREGELGRTAAAVIPPEPSKSLESGKTKETDPARLRMTEARRNELVSARLDQQFDGDGAD